MSEALAISNPGPMNPADVVTQVKLIQQVMSDVMRDGEHYGKVPGCGDKPTLLQPGAEKLAMVFRLAPSYTITARELSHDHREYLVECNLSSIETGQLVGAGVGLCSTMESKYRYRNVSDFEITGDQIPADSKERKAEYRRQGFGMKKVDGVWEWVRYTDTGKTENPDIADTFNTVLKMAKKRALVDAVKSTVAASDIFTQDVEDLPDEGIAPVLQLVSQENLTKIRKLRKALGVSDEKYLEQLTAAQGREVTIDVELTAAAAEKLLHAYAQRENEMRQSELESNEEVPF